MQYVITQFRCGDRHSLKAYNRICLRDANNKGRLYYPTLETLLKYARNS